MSIEYQLQVSRRARRLKLHLNSSGQVVVTAPPLTPKFFINRFVNQQETWITTQQAKFSEQPKLQTDQFVYIFGKKYQFEITQNPTLQPGFTIDEDRLIYHPITSTTPETDIPTKKINAFLRNTAENYILPRTHQLAKTMSINFRHLTLRQQKSRWGSCSSQGNLNFNWRLVHFGPAVIDYVIIHELAHRQEMNHSKSFWRLVAQFDPDYPKHKRVLKKSAIGVE